MNQIEIDNNMLLQYPLTEIQNHHKNEEKGIMSWINRKTNDNLLFQNPSVERRTHQAHIRGNGHIGNNK